MISKGSRYEKAKTFSADKQRSFEFEGIRPREIGVATGVLEHVIKEDDRLDLLALYYYNDPRKWWRIVDANPEILYAGDIPLGRFVESGQDSDGSLANLVGGIILIPRIRE